MKTLTSISFNATNLPKISTLSDMTAITRQQVQAQYIDWDLNQMSVEDLKQYFIDQQNLHLNDLDDEELVEEVKDFAPELIKQIQQQYS